jgi:ankyrin repeat protein
MRRLVILGATLGVVLWLVWKAQPLAYRLAVLNPALARATLQDDPQAVETLVLRGADVNLRTRRDLLFREAETPLMVASSDGNSAMVQRLLSLGADPNLDNHEGTSPLMVAAARGEPTIVRILIEAGAYVSAKDNHGRTPLHWCTTRWSSDAEPWRNETAQVLIRAGADREDIDTALRVAEERPNPWLAAVLRKAGGRGLREELHGHPNGELFYAVRTADMAVLKRLVRQSVKLNVQDADGKTPLIYAAAFGSDAPLRYLMAHARVDAAALNTTDHQGETALITATRMGHQYSARALILAGTNVNVSDARGRTALHYAAFGGQDLLIRDLLRYGAKANVRDEDGKTPAACAREYPHPTTVRLLQQAGDRG